METPARQLTMPRTPKTGRFFLKIVTMEKQKFDAEAVAALSDAMAAVYPAEMYNYYFGGENENPAQFTYCAVDNVAEAIESLAMARTNDAPEAITEMLAVYIAHTPAEQHARIINAACNVQNILYTLTANADALHVLLGVLNHVARPDLRAAE